MKTILFALCLVCSTLVQADVSLSGRWLDYFEEGDSFRTDFSGVTITTREPNTPAGAYLKTGLMVWNVANSSMRITYKVSDWEALDDMSILVGHGLKFDNAATFDLHSRMFGAPRNEWITLTVPVSAWTTEGTVNWTAVDSLLIRVKDNGTKRVIVHVKDVQFITNTAMTPRVSITVDDGLVDTKIVVEELSSRGWAGTAFIDRDFLGTPGYMSRRDITSLDDAGWDIAGHRIGRITQLSPVEFSEFVAGQLQYLDGFKNGQRMFALPNGATEGVYATALSAYTHVFSISGLANNTNNINPQYINRHSIDKHTSLALAKKWIDDAIVNNEWVIINFHSFTDTWEKEEDWSRADLVALLNYIQERGLDVEPVSKVLNNLR